MIANKNKKRGLITMLEGYTISVYNVCVKSDKFVLRRVVA